MANLPSIHLQSMQAESMIQAARQFAEAHGKDAAEQAGRHFEKTVTAFFKTANDAYVERVVAKDGSVTEKLKVIDTKKPNVISNALIALFTEIGKAEKECPEIVRKPSKSVFNKIFADGQSVRGFLKEQIENARINNPELNKEVSIFEDLLSMLHPKTGLKRAIVARSGLVNANEVHKPTRMEKLNAIFSRFLNLAD